MTKKKQKKRKFKWCVDYLLIGYILQTLLLLVMVYSGDDLMGVNWPMFMLIPYGIWGIEIAKENLK